MRNGMCVTLRGLALPSLLLPCLTRHTLLHAGHSSILIRYVIYTECPLTLVDVPARVCARVYVCPYWQATVDAEKGSPALSSDTVSFQVRHTRMFIGTRGIWRVLLCVLVFSS